MGSLWSVLGTDEMSVPPHPRPPLMILASPKGRTSYCCHLRGECPRMCILAEPIQTLAPSVLRFSLHHPRLPRLKRDPRSPAPLCSVHSWEGNGLTLQWGSRAERQRRNNRSHRSHSSRSGQRNARGVVASSSGSARQARLEAQLCLAYKLSKSLHLPRPGVSPL